MLDGRLTRGILHKSVAKKKCTPTRKWTEEIATVWTYTQNQWELKDQIVIVHDITDGNYKVGWRRREWVDDIRDWYTRWSIKRHLFHFTTVFIQTFTSRYSVWHVVCRVNLQYNNIIDFTASPMYCCYTTLGKFSSGETARQHVVHIRDRATVAWNTYVLSYELVAFTYAWY